MLSAHIQHRLVLVQHQTDQFTDAELLRDLDQPSHQQMPDATPMPVAAHRNGELCAQPISNGGIARDSAWQKSRQGAAVAAGANA